MFSTYLELGFDHILDIEGYDHILFVLTLCALYTVKEWRSVLVLVTAFTVGHSLTLALSANDIILANTTLVEILIPITIILTAIANLVVPREKHQSKLYLYILPLAFGLIHGLGFSFYLKQLLGRSDDLLTALFAFNIGVELGQIVIVFIGLGLSYLMINIFKLKQQWWTVAISIAAIAISLKLLLERI